MSLKFSRRKMKVAGEVIEFNTDTFLVNDIDTEMDQVASLMAYWGSVLASATREQMEADASYREWRALVSEEYSTLSEAKIKAKIEAHPKFMIYKKALAKLEENIILATKAFASFDKKGNMLQSRGARERGELEATGMHTKHKSPPAKGKRD
jgi:hypothetical protein